MKSIEIGERRDQIPGKKYCPLRLGFRRLRPGPSRETQKPNDNAATTRGGITGFRLCAIAALASRMRSWAREARGIAGASYQDVPKTRESSRCRAFRRATSTPWRGP